MENSPLPDQPVPPLPTAPAIEGSDKALAVLCHLSFFIGAGFLLPLIVYLLKRQTGSFAEAHAREVLNFHISVILYAFLSVILIIFIIGFPMLIVLALMTLICAIIGAIRASEGGFYYYPFTIRFVP